MIEELLVKNAQLADENTAAQQMRGPFGGTNDSVNEGMANTYGMPGQSLRETTMSAASYRDNIKISADETFTKYANLKSIEYIHSQFYTQKHSREAQTDTKNACFSDLYTQVDDLVKKLYQLFVSFQAQNLKIKTFEETMVQLDDVFTNSANGENEMANLEVAAEIRKMQ